MGFVTRAEAGETFYEDEIKRLNGLVEALDQTIEKQAREIDKQDREITDLNRQMVDVEANFAAIRESNERLRKERDELQKKLDSEIKWWSDRYTIDINQHIGQAQAYENVVRLMAQSK